MNGDHGGYKMGTRKKYCVMVQTDFREEESQHLYLDCAYHPVPEPDTFIDGVGLHYPEILDKGMDPECSPVCFEKKERAWYIPRLDNTPSYMTRVLTAYSDHKSVLVYPHRNKPPLKQPHKQTLAQQYVILEPFNTLSYQGLEYLESCLSFESILNKLETGGGDPSESRSRAVALRLLLRLPAQAPGELEGPPTTTGRVHSRIHLSAKGKHHRVLTPRCDVAIIQQLGRKSAIVLLQKFLRGRAKMISMQRTKARWEESYDELNGFHKSSKHAGMQSEIDFDTSITDQVIIRTLVGQLLGAMFEPLIISVPTSPGTSKAILNITSSG